MTLCSDEMPTCTCTPQISIWRPHHWVRLISSAYRGASVSFWADHFANGWVPAQKSSMPRSRTTRRAGSRVDRRSAIASPALSQIPVTTSTVLRSNSLCTRGFSPISAITAAASLLRSRVSASTSANSHSTPTVGRAEPAKSIRLLSGTDNTARDPLPGVASSQCGLVRGRGAVGLLVALRRDVGEVVGLLVDDDRRLGPCQEVLRGECVGGGHQLGGAVLAHLQRREVAAGGMLTVAGHLEMRPCGVEVARLATGRGNRARFALADRMDVQPMETRCQLTGTTGLHGQRHVAAGECEVGGGHRGSCGVLELGGQ